VRKRDCTLGEFVVYERSAETTARNPE